MGLPRNSRKAHPIGDRSPLRQWPQFSGERFRPDATSEQLRASGQLSNKSYLFHRLLNLVEHSTC
jgi:hypothetical protein